jgi:hypothetical protein
MVQQLLPQLGALKIEKVERFDTGLRLWASVQASFATCLSCGTASERIQGASAAIGRCSDRRGAAGIWLRVRRFVCGNAGGAALTFFEQVDGLARRRLRPAAWP